MYFVIAYHCETKVLPIQDNTQNNQSYINGLNVLSTFMNCLSDFIWYGMMSNKLFTSHICCLLLWLFIHWKQVSWIFCLTFFSSPELLNQYHLVFTSVCKQCTFRFNSRTTGPIPTTFGIKHPQMNVIK